MLHWISILSDILVLAIPKSRQLNWNCNCNPKTPYAVDVPAPTTPCEMYFSLPTNGLTSAIPLLPFHVKLK